MMGAIENILAFVSCGLSCAAVIGALVAIALGLRQRSRWGDRDEPGE
jgi:hypothetical protein